MANTEKLGTKNGNNEVKSGKKWIAFFRNNKKLMDGILIGVLAVILLVTAFYYFRNNQTKKASNAIISSIEIYNRALSTNDTTLFNKALEGDDETDGFLSIISDYKITKTANTAKYYAALCYLQIGNKEESMNYLLDYDKDEDHLFYMAQMLIGDLYDEQKDVDNAKKYYQKAIEGEDAMTAPIALYKLGMIYERENNWAEAYNTYQQIQDKYYERYSEMGVDRNLERAKIKAKK